MHDLRKLGLGIPLNGLRPKPNWTVIKITHNLQVGLYINGI